MRLNVVLVLIVLAAPLAALSPHAAAIDCTGTTTGLIPLTDFRNGDSWRGREGGLYPGGVNEPPAEHLAQGLAIARSLVPRTPLGVPDPVDGKLVFLSIGMSNARAEFGAFAELARADPSRDPRVVLVNGALGGQTAFVMSNPDSAYWRYLNTVLAREGLAPAQVGVVWLKGLNAGPYSDPETYADRLEIDLERLILLIGERFPNARVLYASSRAYAGYASTTFNPEPYAYATAFAVKGLIAGQINGSLHEEALPRSLLAPWMAWGPYLWADGTTPRSDGLVWACSEFASDGTNLNAQGLGKVARMLLDFVHNDPTARVWYMGKALPAA